jgi:putative lipoic acid-binding regulatory protein
MLKGPFTRTAVSADTPAERRPEIDYPCRWEYKTIGRNEGHMREAVGQIMAAEELDYSLAPSNSSRTGKYCSLILAVIVEDEHHRNRIFAALTAHEHIVMVL